MQKSFNKFLNIFVASLLVIACTQQTSVVDPDPDSMGSPDPDSQSGAGSRRAKKTHKNRKKIKLIEFFVKCWLFSFEG
jgi:hypothetical protein